MRIVSFEYEGKKTYGIETNDRKAIWLLEKMFQAVKKEAPFDTLELIENYTPEEITEISTTAIVNSSDPSAYQVPAGKVNLLAPIVPRNNIIGFGKNYQDHVKEVDSVSEMFVFSIATSAVVADQVEIPNHQDVTDELDYEGELALIIGKDAYKVRKEDAYDYIFGYTIVNDVTDRKNQKELSQVFLAKNLAETCPMGPAIVTKDDIKDPHNLRIVTKINGEVRQDSSTNQMIMNIPEIIEYLTKYLKLKAGDVIITGSPGGTAIGMKQPAWLEPGDLMEVTIDKIGTLTNKIAE